MKPIAFLGDWVKIEDENGGFVSENGGLGRGIGEEDKEACTLNVQIVYKTHWMFRPPIYKLPIQA